MWPFNIQYMIFISLPCFNILIISLRSLGISHDARIPWYLMEVIKCFTTALLDSNGGPLSLIAGGGNEGQRGV